MKFFSNPFTALTEAGMLNAMRRGHGQFVHIGGEPCIEYQGCLFRFPEEFHGCLERVEEFKSDPYPIPHKDHPLHLIWRCLMHRLTVPDQGYVYLLRCEEYYKIGITTDLKARMVRYKTENPYPIRLLFAEEVHGYQQVEQEICDFYRPVHHRGEWYRLGPKDVRAIRRAISPDPVGYPLFEGWDRFNYIPQSRNLRGRILQLQASSLGLPF